MPRPDPRFLLVAGAGLALLLIAVPVLGADPSDPPGQGRGSTKERPDKGPELAKELRGTVVETADEKGRPTYSMTIDGVTWELSAGPKWFWGENNPLAAHVGKTVTATGTYHEGETDLSVDAVDGTALREAGRPPWAGGPKAVGEGHPGYKPWKTGPGGWKDGTGDKPGNGPPASRGPDSDD